MRQKKVRGHRRRQKEIDNWRLDHLSIDLADYLLNVRNCYYSKIRVQPWSRISVVNSVIRQPKGETKSKILSGLLDIYEDWKNELEKLDQPYYLKIWLFEPRFSLSQVVCAIGEKIDFYEDLFFRPDQNKILKAEKYPFVRERLKNFNWQYRLDEDEFDDSTVGEHEHYSSKQDYEDSKIWFARMLKKKHRTSKVTGSGGDITEVYSFERGNIWIGG